MRPGVWDFDPDDDFLIADGMERVAVCRLGPDGSAESAFECRGVRESARGRPGTVEAIDLVWHLNAPDLPEEWDRISRGDKLQDELGVWWVVSFSELAGAVDQWRVEAVRAVGDMQP